MSWIVGCYSLDPSSDLFARAAALYPSAVFAVRHEHAYLAVGGDVETALGGKAEAGDPWVVAGLGVFTDHGRRRVMSVDDWSTWFASPEAETPSIGHVALARIKAGAVYLMTDATGLRTLYVTECERGIVFSTRLYWVTRLSGAADLDVHALGSHWTAHQQLSTRAFIKNVTRLGQGARCVDDLSSLSAFVLTAPVFYNPDSTCYGAARLIGPFVSTLSHFSRHAPLQPRNDHPRRPPDPFAGVAALIGH